MDVVRGLAVLSMLAAHVGPGGPVGRALLVSEYLTAPLFATTIGLGAALAGATGPGPHGWVRSHLVPALVRGAVLVVLGLWLSTLGAQVEVILVWLGLLTVLATVLARLPSRAVVGLALALWALGPVLRERLTPWVAGAGRDHPVVSWVVEVAATHWAYRLTALTAWALVGILLARRWVLGRPSRPTEPAVASAVSLAAAGAVLLAGRVVAYSGTHAELVLDAALAVAVVGACVAVVPRAGAAARPLVALGQAALSAYVLQILWLAFYVRVLHPGGRDDSWANLAGMVVAALVLPTAWQAAVPRAPWRRGPVEGLTGALVGMVAPAGPTSPAVPGRTGQPG